MFDELRLKAQHLLAQQKRADIVIENKNTESLLEELQIQQVELEMQNDELRQEQLRNQESSQRLDWLYHHAPVGYLTLNQHGLILDCNHCFLNLLESEEPVVNRSIFNFMPEPEAKQFMIFYKTLFKKPKNIETKLKTSYGTVLDVRFQGCPTEKNLVKDQKEPLLFAVVIDITDLMRKLNG